MSTNTLHVTRGREDADNIDYLVECDDGRTFELDFTTEIVECWKVQLSRAGMTVDLDEIAEHLRGRHRCAETFRRRARRRVSGESQEWLRYADGGRAEPEGPSRHQLVPECTRAQPELRQGQAPSRPLRGRRGSTSTLDNDRHRDLRGVGGTVARQSVQGARVLDHDS